MTRKTRKILLIEDNPGDVRLLQDMVVGENFKDYVMEDVGNLEAGLALLASDPFDVVLLDLTLPDSDGIETVQDVVANRSDVPVIVLTGPLPPKGELDLIKAGAQDFVAKGDFTPALLRRVIDYAIERNRLTEQLTASRREAQRERDLQSLEVLSGSRNTQTTAESYGELSIRISDEQVFELLAEEYESFISGVLNRRAHGDVPGLESRIQGFAQRLGSLRGRPRDLTEIHVAACRRASRFANRRRREAMSSEAQFLLIEVMGYLALYYRSFMGPAPHHRPARELE